MGSRRQDSGRGPLCTRRRAAGDSSLLGGRWLCSRRASLAALGPTARAVEREIKAEVSRRRSVLDPTEAAAASSSGSSMRSMAAPPTVEDGGVRQQLLKLLFREARGAGDEAALWARADQTRKWQSAESTQRQQCKHMGWKNILNAAGGGRLEADAC